MRGDLKLRSMKWNSAVVRAGTAVIMKLSINITVVVESVLKLLIECFLY
jgi:hypothetical protein